MPKYTRPLSLEQVKKIVESQKPSQEKILAAQDSLFMNLLTRVAALEKGKTNAKVPALQSRVHTKS